MALPKSIFFTWSKNDGGYIDDEHEVTIYDHDHNNCGYNMRDDIEWNGNDRSEDDYEIHEYLLIRKDKVNT